jgi:hypothetical protein
VEMIAARRRLLITILFCACATDLYSSGSARQYELTPIRDGKDLSRGNKRVLVTTPEACEGSNPSWLEREGINYAVGFYCGSGRPAIDVWANHIGRHNSAKVTARNSYMGVNLETHISELKHIESFDAGANGRLKIWRFRTYNRNYLLTLIVQPDNEGRTEVDVSLSSEDPAQLTRYLNTLKKVARSIRVVNR